MTNAQIKVLTETLVSIGQSLQNGELVAVGITTVDYKGETRIAYDFDPSNLVAELALKAASDLLADDIAGDYASRLPDNQPNDQPDDQIDIQPK